MSRRAGADRSRGAGRTRTLRTPTVLGGLSAEAAGHLAGLPLDYDGTVERVVDALRLAPRSAAQTGAVVRVIVRDALADPFRETHANRWRTELTGVRPQLIGATVRRLHAAGLLVATGRYLASTDLRGGNGGKLLPVHALNLSVLSEHQAARSDRAATA